jgi:hypothetical protein
MHCTVFYTALNKMKRRRKLIFRDVYGQRRSRWKREVNREECGGKLN